MRIALVTERFLPAFDGSTVTVKAVADRIIDDGHEVRVLTSGAGLTSYRSSRVVRVRPLEKPGGQVRDALTDLAPDLVVVTSPGPVGRKALKHARRLGIATLVIEQSPVLDLTSDYWRAKVADRADTLLVTSRWMVERVSGFGADAGLWTPGVDTSAFAPQLRDPWLHARWSRARSRSGPLVVVGVAGVRSRQDVRRLRDLAALPGIRPVVIGEVPRPDRLRSRLPDVVVTGPLATGDLTVALPSLDVLVHAGEQETCCHLLRAASASGVPVVAPRAGGAPDVVRHLETGVLFDPAAPSGLVRAVAEVAADDRRALLGVRARELVGERDWTVALDELWTGHVAPSTRPGARVV